MSGTSLIQPANDQAVPTPLPSASPTKTCGHGGLHYRSIKAPANFALPTGLLFGTIILTVLMLAGSWASAVFLFKLDGPSFVSGMVGIGVVGVMSLLGVVVMTPWKSRAIADWMTMWLAGTVFRVLLTPIAAYVLYSAFSSPPVGLVAKPLALSVAVAYMIALFVEAAVLSTYLKRYCAPLPQAANSGSQTRPLI